MPPVLAIPLAFLPPPAYADETDPPRQLVTWTNDPGEPSFRIEAEPGTVFTASVRVHFGFRQASWTVGPVVLDDTGLVPLMVPAEAWLDDLQGAYVTDISAFVVIGTGVETTRPAVLAWPNGHEQTPVVWTQAEQELLAPQGILDPALRLPGEHHRVAPPVAWEPAVRVEFTGVDP